MALRVESIKKEVKKADCTMIDDHELPKLRGGQCGYTTASWVSPRKAASRHESLGTDIIERLRRAGQEARVHYHVAVNRSPHYPLMISFIERVQSHPQSPM